jgi:chitinase
MENIDPQLCTHIHYSFATLDKESLHMRFESNNEVDVVKKVNGLKAANPNLKHILALGGGLDSGDGDKYSRLVSSAQSRNSFVQQSVEFLKNYNFDGLGKNSLLLILY